MKKFPISLLCGIGAVLITILAYFLILQDAFAEVICLVTLLCVILSEIITTAFAYFANGKPRRVTAVVVSAAMIPFSIVLSIIYIINFPEGYLTYLGIYTIALIIVNILAFILFGFDSQKEAENDNLQAAKSNFMNMRKMVMVIMSDPAAKPYEKSLVALEEKLHFSNDNVITMQDTKISGMLSILQSNISNPDFDVPSYIADINREIDTRNIMTSRNV